MKKEEEATITCEKCKEPIKNKENKTRVPQSTTENGKTITKDTYYHTECYPGRSISIDGTPNPRLIKKPFIKTQDLIQKITKKEGKITEELEEPLLLLIKENGYIEPIQGVKAGEFTIEQETSQGKPTLKTIYLTPEKIRKLKYGEGSTYYCWVAYENDFDTTIILESNKGTAAEFRITGLLIEEVTQLKNTYFPIGLEIRDSQQLQQLIQQFISAAYQNKALGASTTPTIYNLKGKYPIIITNTISKHTFA